MMVWRAFGCRQHPLDPRRSPRIAPGIGGYEGRVQTSVIPGTAIFLERSELSATANSLRAMLSMTVAAAPAILLLLGGLFTGSTLVSQGIVMWLGLALVSLMILRRSAFRARWGDRAYAVAFRRFAIPGLSMIGVGVAHFAWIEGARILPREIALMPYAYLLLTGIVLWLRAILALGIDKLSMMYVYFPDEGRLVDSNIYGVLRHPVYSAVLRVSFALILWNGSAFALLASLIAPLTLAAWLRWGEEPELIERFGGGYRAYRARVPAFFNLDPRSWPVLWRFLATGK
jgi:protein-S-isoprenylcysteine O-methyltransferase Ste14